MVFWLAVVGFWVLAVPIGAILTFEVELGVFGLWWGFVIGIYLTSLIGIWCLRRVDWDHEAKRSMKRLSSVMSTRRALEPSLTPGGESENEPSVNGMDNEYEGRKSGIHD